MKIPRVKIRTKRLELVKLPPKLSATTTLAEQAAAKPALAAHATIYAHSANGLSYLRDSRTTILAQLAAATTMDAGDRVLAQKYCDACAVVLNEFFPGQIPLTTGK